MIVFDITGGIIAAAGTVLIAATLLWKRSSILREFNEKLERSRNDFRTRLDREISQLFDKLFLEVIHAVEEPLNRLKNQQAQITPLLDQARALSDEARLIA
jgi:hypothetical protein